MKNLKKNNKGFSLVELIVVVLIIAIIAVALAPQVMKWVGEARTSTQKNQEATIKSAVQTCVAEAQAKNVAFAGSFTVTKGSIASEITDTTFKGYVTTALDGFDDSTRTYNVTVSDTGVVTVTSTARTN